MTTKSMGYDNPTYVTVSDVQMGAIAASAASPSATKCVAFTARIIKSLIARIGVSPLTNDYLCLIQTSGTTVTTWTGQNPAGSGATGFIYSTFALGSQPILTQGDQYFIQKGTDTTSTYSACAAEEVVQPLANVTV